MTATSAAADPPGVDAVDVLGSAPGRGQVEAHAAYRAAWRAAGLPEHDRDTLELSLGAHRARVAAWEREQAWGPAYVDNLLAGTHQAAESHRHTAELRRAEAANTTDPDQREQLETAGPRRRRSGRPPPGRGRTARRGRPGLRRVERRDRDDPCSG